MTLKTAAEHQDLQRISVHVPSSLARASAVDEDTIRMEEERAHMLWSDLDPLLVQFWESHSIRTKILYYPPSSEDRGRGVGDWPGYLLPESMKRGIIDLVEEPFNH